MNHSISRNNRRRGTKAASRLKCQRMTTHAARKVAKTVHFS